MEHRRHPLTTAAAAGLFLAFELLALYLPHRLATGRWLARGEYALTAPIGEASFLALNVALAAVGIGAVLLLCLPALHVACTPMLLYVLALVVEGIREPTSHNLLPFELFFMALHLGPQALVVLLPAAMGVGRPLPAVPSQEDEESEA